MIAKAALQILFGKNALFFGLAAPVALHTPEFSLEALDSGKPEGFLDHGA